MCHWFLGNEPPYQFALPASVMPWDLRTESQSAKKRRLEREAQRKKEKQMKLEREKFSSIDQYLISEDEEVH